MPSVQSGSYEEPTGYEWNPPANSTTETITIGAAGENRTDFEPHSYTIWNSDSTSHAINITVVNRSGVVRTSTVTVAPNATVELTLRRSDDFAITIGVFNGSELASQVEINDDSNNFDCNAKGMQIAILEDGLMSATTFSTMVACPDDIEDIDPLQLSTPPAQPQTTDAGLPEIRFVGFEEPTGAQVHLPQTDPVETVAIGHPNASRDTAPHSYTIWNNGSDWRRVRVVVTNETHTLVDTTVAIPANETVTLHVYRPGAYATTIVAAAEDSTTRRLEINDDRNNFDCNGVSVHVAIQPDGRMAAGVHSTLVACPDDSSA